ncbi:MAG: ATP-binding protein, partial [Candidatus Acidiferrales bacterium]
SLLRLARLETGEALMEQSPVDLDALLRHIVADADFEARGRNRFVRIIASELCTIMGNREVLGSAIENVVRNAVGYTKEGTDVEVSLFTSENGAGRRATVRVRDHGRGVPVERLADIFIPFYRVADARERSSGGTGLGLSIAERAVHLHGGIAKAENSPEGGLIVDLQFPVPITASPDATPTVVQV